MVFNSYFICIVQNKFHTRQHAYRTACSLWLLCILVRATLTSIQRQTFISTTCFMTGLYILFCPSSFLAHFEFVWTIHLSVTSSKPLHTHLANTAQACGVPKLHDYDFLFLYHIILIVVSEYLIRSPETVLPWDHSRDLKLCSITSTFFFFFKVSIFMISITTVTWEYLDTARSPRVIN